MLFVVHLCLGHVLVDAIGMVYKPVVAAKAAEEAAEEAAEDAVAVDVLRWLLLFF